MTMKKLQQGATLIEVMVTGLLLSTCLLSMAILQKRSLQFNQGAFMRSQANIYVYDMLDRIRVNRTDLANYNIAYGTASTGSSVAATDITAWRTNISRYLPGGDGAIVCDTSTRICKVSIRWSEEHIFGNQSGGSTACSAVSESCTELIYTSGM